MLTLKRHKQCILSRKEEEKKGGENNLPESLNRGARKRKLYRRISDREEGKEGESVTREVKGGDSRGLQGGTNGGDPKC